MMSYPSIDQFLSSDNKTWTIGPIALIFVEDDVEIATTIRHHIHSGFKSVIVLMPDVYKLSHDVEKTVHRISYDTTQENALPKAVNKFIAAAPNAWMYYCYNAEYLFYPFCETRTVAEMLAFHTEERRGAMLTYVIDLYATDLYRHPTAVSLDGAHLDKSGYYALARKDPTTNHPKERQLDFFGGLRWRYEEHIPPQRRKIDRISLFRAKTGLELRGDYTFNEEEYNTYACPWHNNLTASVVSFRTAKALKLNAGSTFDIHTFHWHNSIPFEWHSRQLLDLGLMEPGQWF